MCCPLSCRQGIALARLQMLAEVGSGSMWKRTDCQKSVPAPESWDHGRCRSWKEWRCAMLAAEEDVTLVLLVKLPKGEAAAAVVQQLEQHFLQEALEPGWQAPLSAVVRARSVLGTPGQLVVLLEEVVVGLERLPKVAKVAAGLLDLAAWVEWLIVQLAVVAHHEQARRRPQRVAVAAAGRQELLPKVDQVEEEAAVVESLSIQWALLVVLAGVGEGQQPLDDLEVLEAAEEAQSLQDETEEEAGPMAPLGRLADLPVEEGAEGALLLILVAVGHLAGVVGLHETELPMTAVQEVLRVGQLGVCYLVLWLFLDVSQIGSGTTCGPLYSRADPGTGGADPVGFSLGIPPAKIPPSPGIPPPGTGGADPVDLPAPPPPPPPPPLPPTPPPPVCGADLSFVCASVRNDSRVDQLRHSYREKRPTSHALLSVLPCLMAA